MSVKIIYKDISPGAKEDISEINTFNSDFSALSDIDKIKNEVTTAQRYATLEHNLWKLDGTYKGLVGNDFPFISKQISDDTITTMTVTLDGQTYQVPTYKLGENTLTIRRVFEHKHQSAGVTITFDNSDYCNLLYIYWYNNDVLQESGMYTPDKSEYYCQKNVELFDRVDIEFVGMNKPNRFLKIFSIDDGVNRIYEDDDIFYLNILEDFSLISEDLKINAVNASIKNQQDAELMFQKNQPLLVYHNADLVGMFFLDEGKRTSRSVYEFSGVDYKGILDNNTYDGGMYFNEKAGDIIRDIFTGEKISLEIDEVTENQELTGYLPICTKKEALMQVLFATCSVCDTSRGDNFRIFKLQNGQKEISADRIKTGGQITTKSKPTNFKIAIHNYSIKKNSSGQLEKTRILDDYTMYKGRIVIEFSNPIDTTPENINFQSSFNNSVTLEKLTTNYCILSLDSHEEANVILDAYEYIDDISIKPKEDENVIHGKATEEKEITAATLISSSNWESVLDNVYDYYMNHTSLESEITIYDEKVGDTVLLHTDWSGDKVGRLERLDYDIQNHKIGKVVQKVNG